VAKVWLCSGRIYTFLYLADDAVAADATRARLMAFTLIEPFTFAKSSSFLNKSAPLLIDEAKT